MADAGKVSPPCGEGPILSADDRMDTDAALLSDESDIELELVDKVGLALSDTNNTRRSPLDITHHHAPTSGSPSPSTSTPLVHRFGCKWDRVDYSCAYDCIFMAFAWIYFHATPDWRTRWAGESAAMKSLSRHFTTILRTLEGPANNRSITSLFSRGRDEFRNILSEEDPTMFRRHGKVNASLADVLHSLSRNETSSKYFSFITSCGGPHCNLKVTTPAGAPFMLTPDAWNSITQSTSPPHYESLQRWISGYFNHKMSSLPRHCSGCDRVCSHTLSFLQPPWIWFEIFVEIPHVVLPSFKISLASHSYRLAAVIYGNSLHFVARLSPSLGTWWYYDGQVNGGQPAADAIVHEEDLVVCRDGYVMNAFVYCPA